MKAIKSLLILVVLLGAAYLAAVWYSGDQTQKYYQDQYTRLSNFLQKHFPEIRVTEQSYDKSFFGAKSVLAIEVDAEPMELMFHSWCTLADKDMSELLPDVEQIQEVHKACEANVQGEAVGVLLAKIFGDRNVIGKEPQIRVKYVLSSEIQHGPWIKGHGITMSYAQSKVTIDNEYVPQQLKDYIASLQIESTRNFSKDMDTYIRGSEISDRQLGDFRIGFNGFTLHTRSYDQNQKSDIELTVPDFHYEMLQDRYKHRFEMKDISIKTTGRLSGSVFAWISSGVSKIDIGKLVVSIPTVDKNSSFQCDKLTFESTANYKNELYSEDMQFAAKCTTNLVDPPLTLATQGTYKLQNIDFKPIVAYLKGYIVFMPKIMDYRSRVSEREVVAEFSRLLNKHLPDFVAPGPAQETDYVISVNEIPQAFRIVSSVKFKPLMEEERKMAWYLMLPVKFSFKVAYYIDESLYEKGMPDYNLPPLKDSRENFAGLFSAEGEEPFVKEGSMYKMEFGYEGGNLLLNGKQTSILDRFFNSRRY